MYEREIQLESRYLLKLAKGQLSFFAAHLGPPLNMILASFKEIACHYNFKDGPPAGFQEPKKPSQENLFP